MSESTAEPKGARASAGSPSPSPSEPSFARKVASSLRPAWPGWRHLPRETRDTLFLLAVIGWTVLPHVSHLPLWCSLLTFVVLLWRTRLALAGAALPNRWVLVGVLVLAAGLTLWSHRTLLGREAGVTMAVVLMALKTLELRARRDAFVVFFLGFFLILTHFLYSQSLLVAGAMLVSVWGLMTALVLAHMPVGQPSLRQAAVLSARTAILGAPIMALMFVLFPRIGPLWGVPQDGLGKTGLSGTMHMGSVAELALDDSIALRIRFEDNGGAPPPPETLYFRGPVLTRFDGTEWRSAPTSPRDFQPRAAVQPAPQRAASAPATSLPKASPGALSSANTSADTSSADASSTEPGAPRVSGPAIRYEMTLEPLKVPVLPLLELTTTAPQIDGLRTVQLDDLQWVTARPIFERVRFQAVAHREFQHGPLVRNAALQTALDWPTGSNPRTLAWATALRAEPRNAQASPRTLALAVMQHIRTGGYTYTLAPGEYNGANSIDAFWLDRREGFCEHFAAAFVMVMRAMDVPARIVTGYQGAEPEPVDGFYLVRQSSAHAWAEYWQEGIGWIRADPTAAVAPDRIVRSRNLVPAPSLVAEAFGSVNPELLAQLRNGWEAINNRWNQWVLNYSRGSQIDVLKHLGFDTPSWEDLTLLLIGALSSLALAGAAWAWWDRHRVDPWVRQMERWRAALRQLGLEASAHDAPRALAQRVRGQFGDAGEPTASLLDALERQRYAPGGATRPDGGLTRRFVAAARRLRPLVAR